MPQEATAYFPNARCAPDAVEECDGVLVRVGGLGKVHSALATQQLIAAGAEAIVIGGPCATLIADDNPGDTYLVTRAVQHDYGVLHPDALETLRPGAAPGQDADTNFWFEAGAALVAAAQQHVTQTATMASGDAFVACPRYVDYLHNTLGAQLLDMESGGAAQTCAMLGVPWIGIKTVTDHALSDSVEEFWANLPAADRENAVRGRQLIADLEAL